MDAVTLGSFALVSFAVAIAPGPSWAFVISSTINGGLRGGFTAVLGNATGIMGHVVAVALGISAVFAYSAVAYHTIKWIGVAYLIWLGVRAICRADTNSQVSAAKGNSERERGNAPQVFRDGVLVNLFNPKVALLMLTLLPQFVRPEYGNVTWQIVAAGVVHALIASTVLSAITVVTHRSREALRGSARFTRFARWFAGAVLIGLGLRLAFSRAE